MKINELLKIAYQPSYLYVLNLAITKEVLDQFRGIKYVCMQGSGTRAQDFASKLANKILHIDSQFFTPINLTNTSNFHCYRIGNILSVSHGMGNTSILTLLHSLSKLMYFAGNYDLEYIRIGTSGGINIEPGNVILTECAYMPNLKAEFKMFPLGKEIAYPTTMNSDLNQRIINAQTPVTDYKILIGNSIAADDFYMGQARFDGAIKPNYDDKKRQEYFSRLQQLNILNFEMESSALAAFCNRADIPATMIAATILNRALGDQLTVTGEMLTEYSNRAQLVAINYLLHQVQ